MEEYEIIKEGKRYTKSMTFYQSEIGDLKRAAFNHGLSVTAFIKMVALREARKS